MTFLRHTLTTLALSASLFGVACTADNAGNESANTTNSVVDNVMDADHAQPSRWDISRNYDGEWFFHLLGPKGEIYLFSQGYVEKPSSYNGILSVEENGVHLENYEVVEIGPEEFSFVLRAGNNQVIADGAKFRTPVEAEAGILEARDLVAAVVQYKAAKTDGARFDLWRDQDDKEWYFVMRADDGRVLLESESYTGRTGALNGIDSVRENGKQLEKYDIVIDADGTIGISLKAGNGQEIAENGPLASEQDAQALVTETHQLLDSERVANPW
jgi:uncharacterized protein